MIPSNLSIFSSLYLALHSSVQNSLLDGCFLPNGVDLRQVIILPKAEWERMQDNLGSISREAARILAEKKEREEMHRRSKAAVKDWPNTIMVNTRHICKLGDACRQKHNNISRCIPLV